MKEISAIIGRRWSLGPSRPRGKTSAKPRACQISKTGSDFRAGGRLSGVCRMYNLFLIAIIVAVVWLVWEFVTAPEINEDDDQ